VEIDSTGYRAGKTKLSPEQFPKIQGTVAAGGAYKCARHPTVLEKHPSDMRNHPPLAENHSSLPEKHSPEVKNESSET
jgi:hypothetical protein